MNWTTIRSAIRSAVISASGLTDVEWRNTGASSGMRLDPHVDLVLRSPVGIGIDEPRYTYDEDTDQLIPALSGQRSFAVSVRIVSQDQGDGAESVGARSSSLRTRLRRESVAAALYAAGISLASIRETIEQDFESDDRMFSLGITDIIFLAAENDVDDVAAGDWIKSTQIDSDTLRDVDGLATEEQISLLIERPD